MASGVKLADKAALFLKEMKLKQNDARLATFKVNGSFIVLDQCFTQADLEKEGKDVFEVFKNELTPKQCKYIVYDCHFGTKESSTREDLTFVAWCPSDSVVKEKMIYAASKSSIENIEGFKHKLQFNEACDCLDRAMFADSLANRNCQITQIEGVPI